MEDYSEYLIQGEPNKRERVRSWMTAIELQDVDGLILFNYMLEIVYRYIKSGIANDEIERFIEELILPKKRC